MAEVGHESTSMHHILGGRGVQEALLLNLDMN